MFTITPRPLHIPVITPLLARRNSAKKSPKVRKKSGEKSSFFSRRPSWRSSNKWKPNWKALGVDKSNEWDAFTKDLKSLKEWLEGASAFIQTWRAPEHNVVSIRTQLERHLAFALEVKSHQYQLENILSTGRQFLETFPQLGEILEDSVTDIETQWDSLDNHLSIQSKQIQEALAVVETSIGASSLQDEDVEQLQDTLDHMTLRLTCNQSRLPPVEETLSSTQRETQNNQSPRVSAPVPCSSSPDFEALYSDLNDWLDDMQLAVTDSNDVFISEPQKEQMCQGYEQELQLREVSRSKLQRKGLQLMSSNPNLAEQVRYRLESLNQRWQSLQSKLLAPIKPKNNKKRKDSSSSIFTTSEEAISVVLEVEDVISRLKVWLTGMERQLFSSQGSLDQLSRKQLDDKKSELEVLQADISKHSPGIEMVLSLCDLLIADEAVTGFQRDQDNLKLTAFNLDRRWQAVQAQSRDLFLSLEKKMEEVSQVNQNTVTSLATFTPTKSSTVQWCMAPHRHHPTPCKDDDAVDGFTFRVNDMQRRLEIEELVIAREAFSENDAYSISDTSDVSLCDLDFDDVLPMKVGDDAGVDDEDEGTPEIMDFADDIFDKYLEMENAILQSEEGDEPDETPTVGLEEDSQKDVEFWTMSPKEAGTFNFDSVVETEKMKGESCGAPQVNENMSVASITNEDQVESIILEVPGEDCDSDDCDNDVASVSDLELDERELLEDGLWDSDSCSSIDEEEEDEEDLKKVKPPSCEEAAEAIFQAFNFPLDKDCPDDVFECTAPLPHSESVLQGAPSNIKTILCQSWPMKSPLHSVLEKSPSIENLTTPFISQDIDRFFPSFLGEELSYNETKRGLDSLRLNLNLPPSHEKSLDQSKEEEEETEDALLEITDLSLSHMYESLDFITELTSRLATDSLSTSPSSSQDYHSCASLDDIDTTSTFSESAPKEIKTVWAGMPKQEMAALDNESSFPASFESRPIASSMAEDSLSDQEMPGKSALPESKPVERFSHVAEVLQCVNALDTHNSDSESEVYFDSVSSVGLCGNMEAGMSAADENSNKMSDKTEQYSLESTEITTPQALSEVPCTFVNGSEELKVAKQGYMSYVSQLTEASQEGDLMNYLDSVKLKKCYLWSMTGSSGIDGDQEGVKDPETENIEKELSDLLLKPEDMERKWELDSLESDDTDKLMEASSALLNELNNQNLEDTRDGSDGDWKDVIVLWLDQNKKAAEEGTEIKKAELVESVRSESFQRRQPYQGNDETDCCEPGRMGDMTDGGVNGQIVHTKYSDQIENINIHEEPSVVRRVILYALPIQVILYLCIILVLVLPSVVETSSGDCYLSLSDNLLMDSHRLGPIVNYIRGPPPV